MATSSPAISMSRLEQAAALLADENLDLLIVTPSADLRYLLGKSGHASERPAILAIPREGEPVFVLAAFEAVAFSDLTGISIMAYDEVEDPFGRLHEALGPVAVSQAAISDQA